MPVITLTNARVFLPTVDIRPNGTLSGVSAGIVESRVSPSSRRAALCRSFGTALLAPPRGGSLEGQGAPRRATVGLDDGEKAVLAPLSIVKIGPEFGNSWP